MSDLFRKAKSNFATTLVTGIGTGTGDTITLNSTTGLPTDTEITLTFNRVTSSGTVNSTTVMERITGTISGATLTAYTRGVDGTTEQAHAGGTVVEYIPNAADMNDQVDGILVAHNQDGTHKSGSVLTLPQINDTTADHKYVTAVNELTADRTVTLPLLTGNDEFVFKDHTQTLTNKTLTTPTLQGSVSGWIVSTDTWVYASASTFTIAGVDRTTTYTKGTRLKWNEGATVKYGVVVGSSFSTNTTVTILKNTDYTISNTTLSSAAYSYVTNPQGYPTWFNLTAPTFTVTAEYGLDDGSGGQPTTTHFRCSVVGSNCFIKWSGSGTKVGGDNEVKFNTSSVLPALVNGSVLQVIGVSYFHPYIAGTLNYVNSGEWRIISPSSIADNTSISYVYFNGNYEF